MLAKRFPWMRNKPIAGLGALVLAAALFGGGLATGISTNAPRSNSPAATTGVELHTGGQKAGSSASVVDTGTPGSPNGAVGSSGTSLAICPGTLSGVVVNGTTLDLAQSGLTPRLPGAGFDLQSVSVRSSAPCNSQTPGSPVLDTQWRQTATGLEVWISQAAGQKAVADVVNGTTASFTFQGDVFQVNVGPGVMTATDAKPGATSTSSGSAPASGPMIPATDPRASELLKTVIANLAPSLSDGCFAHQVTSGWDGLATLGIGDPRPAIPSGFTQQSITVETYQARTTDCGPEFRGGGSFNAMFMGDNGQEALGMNVNFRPQAATAQPGFISDYNISWTDDQFTYNVWMKSPKADRSVLTAVAKALDPSLDVSTLKDEPSGGRVEPMPAPAQPSPSDIVH